MGKRWLTSRCSRRGCRESFKRQFSFAVVLVTVGHVALAATRLSSQPLARCIDKSRFTHLPLRVQPMMDEVIESKRETQVAAALLVVGLVIVIGASACLGKTRFSSSQELICDSVSYAEALDK
jgi:hypothetical protein